MNNSGNSVTERTRLLLNETEEDNDEEDSLLITPTPTFLRSPNMSEPTHGSVPETPPSEVSFTLYLLNIISDCGG